MSNLIFYHKNHHHYHHHPHHHLITSIIVIISPKSHMFTSIAHDTSCSTNLSASRSVQEYDVITMTCSITYNGNWAPVMRWFNSVTRHNFTDDVTTLATDLTTNDTTVTSQLTVTATADLDGSKIVCVTYFTQLSTSLPINSSTNVPSFTYTWTVDIQCCNINKYTPTLEYGTWFFAAV